ncbi:hypothetical protein GLYMA_19G068900v4 [Glycine max]|uniref:Uncharacterized protein n=1 Tax=Glycine max TaxID=3847 RepID=A0A0R0EUT5_SOYBN|nr:hypothetical protein GYH30_052232 [Glycine max]KRG94216.1 hypothetical protein GLYMA_19G068900v4 [Glycine max]
MGIVLATIIFNFIIFLVLGFVPYHIIVEIYLNSFLSDVAAPFGCSCLAYHDAFLLPLHPLCPFSYLYVCLIPRLSHSI